MGDSDWLSQVSPWHRNLHSNVIPCVPKTRLLTAWHCRKGVVVLVWCWLKKISRRGSSQSSPDMIMFIYTSRQYACRRTTRNVSCEKDSLWAITSMQVPNLSSQSASWWILLDVSNFGMESCDFQQPDGDVSLSINWKRPEMKLAVCKIVQHPNVTRISQKLAMCEIHRRKIISWYRWRRNQFFNTNSSILC